MSANDDESPQRFALGLVFFLVAAVVIFAIIFGIHHVRRSAAGPQADAAPAAVVLMEAEDVPPIAVVDGVVKFYFATGKADVTAGANEALADVVKAVLDGKTAVIRGFHDATGDAAANAELAKQRAFAVRDVLKALGVAEDKVVLQKPEQTLATGSNLEARRVEVSLQ